jgi:hypothetical protein
LIHDAIILGGGAAGLFCAAIAGQRGRRVAVVDHNAQFGRKILISGGGRANFTNRRVGAENFLCSNRHFAKSALARYTPADFLKLVERHRIAWHEKTLGQLFCDGSAREILDMLLAECAAGNVELKPGTRVTSVSRDTRFRLDTSAGVMESAALVVASGGLSIPKMGATGFGYEIARRFGLAVVEPFPALVPLVFGEDDRRRWCDLAGVSAGVLAQAGGVKFREQMLLTHRGVSGPAILQASSYWRPGEPVRVDLLPDCDFTAVPPQNARAELLNRMPSRFGARWLEVEGFTQPLPSVRKLNARLHDWRFTPAGTEGFEKAEVTGGGVSTGELSSQTMEARRVPGLYFIGEVVDVTGWLGGYNFQWAWSSAHAAARAL